MRGAAIVALVLVAGALLAHLLLTDPGYVAIRLGRTLPGGDAVEVLSGLKGDETLALDPVQAGIQARSAAAAR